MSNSLVDSYVGVGEVIGNLGNAESSEEEELKDLSFT